MKLQREVGKLDSVEILAPCGSWEALKAAINAGADAVYLGGFSFGARAFAENFDEETLVQAIEYVHLHHRKIYLTVNTLLKESEISTQLFSYLKPYYEAGLDAVIVQDIGVIRFIREYFPGLEIHASTQMSITSSFGAQLLQEMGATRIVPARELSLEEVKEIAENVDVELECFVHGAMCYSYSGQCLYSSFLGGRSGNRGQCAQPCRLPYRKENDTNTCHWLSMKDMNTLELLPQLLMAGVDSFKIEGRMKSPEYVAFTVALYRKYVDQYMCSQDAYLHGDEKWEISKQDRELMAHFYNRGASGTGYYETQNGKSTLSIGNSSFQKGSPELEQRLRNQFISADNPIPVCGNGVFMVGERAQLTVTNGIHKCIIYGEIIQSAQRQPLTEERIREQLQKTGGTDFSFEELHLQMGDCIFMSMKMINTLRREALDELRNLILADTRRTIGNHGLAATNDLKVECQDNPSGISVLVESLEQLDLVLSYEWVSRIYLDGNAFLQGNKFLWKSCIQGKGNIHAQLFIAMPHVFRSESIHTYESIWSRLAEEETIDGILARTYDEIGFLRSKKCSLPVFFDYQLYLWNSYAHQEAMNMGVSYGGSMIPLELHRTEINSIPRAQRELLLYGYVPMMISAQCIRKTAGECKHISGYTKMTDRYHTDFYVKNCCQNCYNVIYNSVPLSLMRNWKEVNRLGHLLYRLEFTKESLTQIQEIMHDVEQLLENENYVSEAVKEYTKGHWSKGVS